MSDSLKRSKGSKKGTTVPNHDRAAAFILTHGRPNKVVTYGSLLRSNWTRPIYIIIDNEDKTGDEYREIFGEERVIEFDKAAVAETFDTADTQQDRRAIVYARNACWKIAEDLGLDYHFQLDDDYTSFSYRFIKGDTIVQPVIRSLDEVFEAMMTFLDESGALTVAMSQGGDHMGGIDGPIRMGLKRKAMNSFVLRTDRQFDFVGRINEDVNTYVTRGMRGDLLLTALNLQLTQISTQQNNGGMTEMYLDSGTYVKTFYSVMMAPASVKVKSLGYTHRRMHHNVRWDNTVPKILNESHRKP